MPKKLGSAEILGFAFQGKWGDQTDFTALIAAANEHLVPAELYGKLVETAENRAVDPEALEYLASVTARNSIRNARLFEQLLELIAALNSADIIPTLLKGAVYLIDAPDPAQCLRIMRDIDLLIAPHELNRARSEIDSLGYKVFERSSYAHSPGSFYRVADVGAIDLHVLLPGGVSDLLNETRSGARLEMRKVKGGTCRIPNNELRFLINLFHDMIHDNSDKLCKIKVRHLLELYALSRKGAPPIDWVWIASKCRDRRSRLALETQSRMIEHLFGPIQHNCIERSLLGSVHHQRRVFLDRYPGLAKMHYSFGAAVKRSKRGAARTIQNRRKNTRRHTPSSG